MVASLPLGAREAAARVCLGWCHGESGPTSFRIGPSRWGRVAAERECTRLASAREYGGRLSDQDQRSSASRPELWRARDYADRQDDRARPDYQEGLLRTRPGPGTSLLDLGCGAGGFCWLAADAGASFTGVDASAGMIEIARERVPEGRFHVADIQVLPFEDSAFDVVTAFNSLQFTADPRAVLGEVRRCSSWCLGGRSAWGRSRGGARSRLCFRRARVVPPAHLPSPDRV